MTSQAMQHYPQSPIQRLGLASGIAFFGLLFASISASVYYPDDATPDQIAAWYAGNGGALTVPALLEGLALVSFLVFLVRLMALLRERSEGRMRGTLILGGALMVTTLRILAYSTDLAQVLIARAGGGYAAFVALDSLHHLVVHYVGFPLAITIAGMAAAMFRTRIVARPIAAIGLLAALMEIVGLGAIYETVTGAAGGPMHMIEFYGVQLFGFFVLVLSVALLVQSRPRRAPAQAREASVAAA